MTLQKKRLDLWKTAWQFPAHVAGTDSYQAEGNGFLHTLLLSSKEIIFDFENDNPKFYFLHYALDADTLDLVLSPSIAISGLRTEGILNLLEWATLYHIPLFANTDSVLPKLLEYHRMLLDKRFSSNLDAGDYIENHNFDQNLEELLNSISPIQSLTPLNFQLFKEALVSRFQELQSTYNILNDLKLAIDKLHKILQSDKANEQELQECLTQNPIFFGIEYRRVIPQYRLGSEFIADYALERVSGLIDFVEIESSTHKLYNKKGDPSAALTHAERQVQDWLIWIENEFSYARRNLPKLQQPVGYVIIGRKASLTDDDHRRLNYKNNVNRGSIIILTYDDLLDRASNILSVISPIPAKFTKQE